VVGIGKGFRGGAGNAALSRDRQGSARGGDPAT
jgi:hypothetical protein